MEKNKVKFIRLGIEFTDEEYSKYCKPKWYQFRLKRWLKRMKVDWMNISEEEQQAFHSAISDWVYGTRPKSKSEILCDLTKWYFPDGENWCVDIPSEGIHAFYGRLGFLQAVGKMITYLEKLRSEFDA